MKTSLPHSKKAEQMRNVYDGTAEFYDSRYKVIQYLKYGILLHTLINPHSLPQIDLQGPILDNGGGTGLFMEFLQDLSSFLGGKKGNNEKVNIILEFTSYLIKNKFGVIPISVHLNPMIVCDISSEMLRVARKFQDSRALYGLVACDSSHLPFRASQFSTITAFTVFQNVLDMEQAISESSRVITAKGILGSSVLEKSSDKLQFAELLGKFFDTIQPVHFEGERGDFQKIIVQNSKYSQFHDLEKVEDFFLTAKKSLRKEK